MHLRPVNMHIELQLLTDSLDVLETLLIIRPRATDPDLDFMFGEELCEFAQRTDDALEGGCDVCEVGDAAADEEDLAVVGDGGAKHEVEHGSGVVVGLCLGGRAGVFAVVGEFVGEAGRGDGVGVDDGGTTSGDECPYTAIRVEDGELQRGTGFGIHLGDVGFFFAQLTTERRREFHRWASVNADLGVGLDTR